ncbi:DUF6708 domain-containing protein [Pseudomonas sp. NFACC02]|uniref:DUF6708 domain-containing protein n=1 Tax=Pseudomonas sp. NFACC02 TaxID=1566250 RepID=UPI000AE07EB5|nr:DUF6708 domain-containing protein [Pseudomonas sp. NFACC02]
MLFNNLFKRKHDTSPEQSVEDIRSQRPRAGEIRRRGLNETLFLSPLPVFTGQVQMGRRNFSQMNDTFLELGGSNVGTVDVAKRLAFGVLLMLCTAFVVPLLISLKFVFFSSSGIERQFFNTLGDITSVFALGSLLSIIPLGGYVYGMLRNVRIAARSYPVRFNRQRREVCYVNDETQRVLIVPWENVVAWVANSQGVSSYGALRDYTFGMGLEDEEQDTVQFLLLAQPSDAHALGMWTAIRNYMEEGEWVDTPSPWIKLLGLTLSEDELKPYEGLHTFDIERRSARFMGGLDSGAVGLTRAERERFGYSKPNRWPLRLWYLRRILTFWKLPYIFAEWSHRKGRPEMPEQVKAWSRPIPPEQWAKPSAALKKANAVMKDAMGKKGMTFVQACKAAGLHR